MADPSARITSDAAPRAERHCCPAVVVPTARRRVGVKTGVEDGDQGGELAGRHRALVGPVAAGLGRAGIENGAGDGCGDADHPVKGAPSRPCSNADVRAVTPLTRGPMGFHGADGSAVAGAVGAAVVEEAVVEVTVAGGVVVRGSGRVVVTADTGEAVVVVWP